MPNLLLIESHAESWSRALQEIVALREAAGQGDQQLRSQIGELNRQLEDGRQAITKEMSKEIALRQEITSHISRCKELEDQLIDAEDVRRKLHNMVQVSVGSFHTCSCRAF